MFFFFFLNVSAFSLTTVRTFRNAITSVSGLRWFESKELIKMNYKCWSGNMISQGGQQEQLSFKEKLHAAAATGFIKNWG